MKVGIFGGTFNPIHNGHLLIAENAYDQFNLDRVVFLPTGKSPHKQDKTVLNGNIRCEMVASAIKDIPYFTYDRKEVDSEKVNYTFETLEYFHQLHSDWEMYFIMGADSLLYFDKWVKPEVILKHSTVLIAARDHVEQDGIRKRIQEITNNLGGAMDVILTPEFNVASRDIRTRVAKKESIRFLVPEDVRAMIMEEKLYSDLEIH